MTTVHNPFGKRDLRIYAGAVLTVVSLASLVAIPVFTKIIGVWGIAWATALIGLMVGLFLLALAVFENLSTARENKARENWDPIVTWKYGNGEWDLLRQHQLASNKTDFQKSQKRLRITWQLFVILGLVLFIGVGLAGDWLVGAVMGIVIGGFGAGIMRWHQQGEQKDAARHLDNMLDFPAIGNSYVVEIAKAGYSINNVFRLWDSSRSLGQISIVEKPLPAIRFEYYVWQSDLRLKKFDLIPIPQGCEREAEKLVRQLQS
jgi:Flp pilus assembly protein TadB